MPDAPPSTDPAPDKAMQAAGLLFTVFNELAIVNQLATAMFEARLPPGFLVSQFGVLNHLVRVRDGRTPLDLARAFQVPKTTMTHTLGLLERHGLVRVAPNPDDGRSKCVWLTDAGRAFRDDAIASLAPDLAALVALLDMPGVSAMLPVLQGVRKAMDEARNS